MNSHRRNRVFRVGVLIVLGLAVGSADIPARAAVPVTAAQGTEVATLSVTLDSAMVTPLEGEPQELKTDDIAVVQVGDEIAVSSDGEAVLTFFEGVETRIAAGSTVRVEQFETSDSGTQIGLGLVLGQTVNDVQGLADSSSRFEIDTPAATITVRGTRFVVFARESKLTQVATLEGTVQVAAQGQSTDLPYGFGVKLMPGDTPSPLLVWGLAQLQITAPEGVTVGQPSVIWTNTDNQQAFYYRAGDLMTFPLGTYDLLLGTPGPVRMTGIAFPQGTPEGEIQQIPVALGAIALSVVDSSGNPVSNAGSLLVTLHQGDLSGEVTVAPDEPFLAGPGIWQLEVAPESQPEHVQTLAVTVEAGQIATAPVASTSPTASGSWYQGAGASP
jgi:hypothetical protein